MQQPQNRLPVVDGLRAFAVVAVVLFHGFPSLVTGGFIGVDVFFVISGFVIALSYLQPMIRRDVTFRAFFIRRIRRLVPAYLAVLLVTTAFALWLLNPKDLANYGASLAGQAFYAQNIVFWNQGDYFDGPLTKPLLHTWSLAVEEQFYLFFPLAIIVLRWRPRLGLAMLVTAALASLTAGAVIGPISPKTPFYWLPFRTWEFFAGIFAAILFQRPIIQTMPIVVGSGAALAGLGGIFIACFGFGERADFPGVQALLAVSGTVLICLTQMRLTPLVASLFTNRVAQHAGRISYSWYLWHWPLIVFFFVVMHRSPVFGEASIITIIGYALGALSFATIERWGLRAPIMKRRTAPIALLSGFLIFAASAGFFIVANNGLIGRYPAAVQPLYAAQMERAPYRCPLVRRLRAWDAEICQLNDVQGLGGVLIVGDSHADMMKAAIVALGDKRAVPVYLVKQNCRLVDFGVDKNCARGLLRKLARDIRANRIATVLAISHWPKAINEHALFTAADAILATGAQLVVQRSTPEGAIFDPAGRMANGATGSDRSGYSSAQFAKNRRANDLLFDRLDNRDRVQVLDPAPILCPNGDCSFARNGVPLYSDTNHLTSTAARMIAPLYPAIFDRTEQAAR
ncbi:acyltransferase family protein [Sphingomonas sp. PB4P5]|uniref:acyltransferase family protein n=1 Tax=Parasphingomonas puruogangriensis TaxID=3096155 RepID=UPI002FC81813